MIKIVPNESLPPGSALLISNPKDYAAKMDLLCRSVAAGQISWQQTLQTFEGLLSQSMRERKIVMLRNIGGTNATEKETTRAEETDL